MEIKVCKLKEIEVKGELLTVGKDTIEVTLPTYGKEGDACMDIYPIAVEYDEKRDRFIYHTGLAFAIGNSNNLESVEEKDKAYKFTQNYMPNEMEIRPRSNLTKSEFYMPNSPATLDWGYRGELLIIFKNRTASSIVDSISLLTTAIDKLALRTGTSGEIKQYTSAVRRKLNTVLVGTREAPYKCDGIDRCAQLIIRGAKRINWKEVSFEDLGKSERGVGGFGSTGGAVK